MKDSFESAVDGGHGIEPRGVGGSPTEARGSRSLVPVYLAGGGIPVFVAHSVAIGMSMMPLLFMGRVDVCLSFKVLARTMGSGACAAGLPTVASEYALYRRPPLVATVSAWGEAIDAPNGWLQ